MLLELHITDFAIIEQLELHFTPGFNVLTGETGAGKSIIIDALGVLRGDRPDPAMVRAGSPRARIEGVFHIAGRADLHALLREYDLHGDDDGDDLLIITREVNADSGRSTARINRRAVNSTILRDVGTRLIDIHGQHEGLAIYNPRTHLDMLDRFGGLYEQRNQIAALVEQLGTLRRELAALRASEDRRQQRIEELQVLLEDVQQANLRPDEEAELLQERQVMQHAVRITELVANAYATLYEGDEHAAVPFKAVIDLMARVVGDLSELARYDHAAAGFAEHAEELHVRLQDLADGVRDYRDRLDFDPRRLDEIEDRLTVLKALQRKYNADSAAILAQAANAEAELERLAHSSEHIADMEAQEATLKQELGRVAATLSLRRRAVSDDLAQRIEVAMRDLAMQNVHFAVSITHETVNDGVPVPPDVAAQNGNGTAAAPLVVACDRTGIDTVEFLLSPNPGEPLKPLAKIASGGESARLLLALKSILSKVDEVPTMVFDEIDVGVGGRAGQVVGHKLWGISDGHQVLCITHLPQVAAFADSHFAIAKEVVESAATGQLSTRTRVHFLDPDERTDELAAMLDGTPVSDASRASAREIIERASALKQGTVATVSDGR